MSNPFDLLHPPAFVTAFTGEDARVLTTHAADSGIFEAGDIHVITHLEHGRLAVDVSADTSSLERIYLRWPAAIPTGTRFLGDAWERAYGDLEWRGLIPERIMPWYFLAYDGQVTRGCGVMTGAGALCFWMVDAQGTSLWLDVRCGGAGVMLRGRTLRAAEIACHPGNVGISPFASARTFCQSLCDQPRLPARPVYGSNNWYYAYGQSNHQQILKDAEILVSQAPAGENRPYMVIDAGWQPLSGEEQSVETITGGPYTGSNRRFPDMAELAAQIRRAGALPGIWIRPLAAYPDDPQSLLLPVERAVDSSAKIKVMDPSLPEVLERIQADFRRLHDWGYALIKHDWATCDILGRWGYQMGAALTNPGWRFHDSTRTTAEITQALYRAIRAGSAASVVIGCNTMGHLAAGLFELQRTGDDTSGRVWERTRKYGINTLAFRAPQHDAFFAADPDCIGHTSAIPWELNAQFLDLLSHSGMPLFVSIDPAEVGAEQQQALKAAFAAAAQPQPVIEPLDWLDTTCPALWNIAGEPVQYHWVQPEGVRPLAPSIPSWWG